MQLRATTSRDDFAHHFAVLNRGAGRDEAVVICIVSDIGGGQGLIVGHRQVGSKYLCAASEMPATCLAGCFQVAEHGSNTVQGLSSVRHHVGKLIDALVVNLPFQRNYHD